MRRWVGAAALGLVVTAAVGVVVPSRPARAAPAVPSRTAWIEGDSVLLGAADDTRADLARDAWRATVAPFGGLQLVAAIDVFRNVRPEMGSVAVIELGNNYIGDPSAFGAQIDEAMSVLSGMHVIWLTTALFEPRQAVINDQIWAAARRWRNLDVMDWSATVRADPWAVGPDGLHLTTDGRALMAGMIRQRLDAWYCQFTGPARPVVAGYGGAPGLGPSGQLATAGDAAGIAATPTGGGYWVAGGDGGVLTYGDARYYGSAGGLHLASPVVGMAATPDGRGYWLVGADGGILTYGDAGFFGSAGALNLASPVMAMAGSPDGRGYWLVASDGGVFTYGDARFSGSAAGAPAPLSGAAFTDLASRPGGGYWLLGQQPG